MKRDIQMTAVRQAVNGLAEMYADLTAKVTALEGKVARLEKAEGVKNASYWASEVMDEYFNGKEKDDE